MRDARGTVGQGGGQPAAVEEATGGDDRGCPPRPAPTAAAASSATGPVWPPPSPPCTITASAPQPATFLACLAAPTDGITTTPASLSLAIRSRFRRQRERGHLDALADQQVDAVVRVTGVGADVDAERFVGGGLDLGDRGGQFRRASWSPRPGCRARRRWRSPPPAARPATQPMPVCTTGMLDADQLGQGCAQLMVKPVLPCPAVTSDR